MTTFKTNTVMVDLSGRRFVSLPLGETQITLVRGEHSRLMRLAAAVLGVPAEELNYEAVESFAQRLEEERTASSKAASTPA